MTDQKQLSSESLKSEKVVSIIKDAFRKFDLLEDPKCLKEAAARIRQMVDYSPADLGEFVRVAASEFHLDAVDGGSWGEMLTFLIQEGPPGEYVIPPSIHLINLGCELERSDVTIRVLGDVGEAVGYLMKKGRIVVEGNAEDEAGVSMEGGELHIIGDVEGFGVPIRGKIYQWGELVYDNGWK